MSAAPGAEHARIPASGDDFEVKRLPRTVSATIDSENESIEVKRRRAWPGNEVSAIAARQRTLITRTQLVALGVGRNSIRRALERGRIHSVHRGVYATISPDALPDLAAEQAAVLACGPGTYLSHHAAAAAWGFRPSIEAPDRSHGGGTTTAIEARDPYPSRGLN